MTCGTNRKSQRTGAHVQGYNDIVPSRHKKVNLCYQIIDSIESTSHFFHLDMSINLRGVGIILHSLGRDKRCFYSLSRKTVNARENFRNVYCFATNQMRDETAKDNRQTAELINHDLTRNNELASSSTTNL